MKEFIQGMYHKPHFAKRFIFCFLAVSVMGFGVSWLNLIQWGTDPYSVLSLAIAGKLGISYGNWLVFFNVLLFLIVILKDKSNIGFGTLLNMVCVGYACDFMTWLRNLLLPGMTFDTMAQKVVIMVIALVLFIFAVSVYMSVDLGTSPYDSVPFIVTNAQKKVSFRTVRIIWDCTVTLIGFLMGGVVGIVTVIMSLAIGPVATWVSKRIQKYIQ